MPKFVGELINKTELEGRINAGRGGYIIQIDDQTSLDCFNSRSMHHCLSSCANSAHENYPVRNINTGQAGQINCRLLKYFDKSNFDWRFNLAALELIPAHTELLANYEPFVARDNE